jgi:ankyrin repeat protein
LTNFVTPERRERPSRRQVETRPFTDSHLRLCVAAIFHGRLLQVEKHKSQSGNGRLVPCSTGRKPDTVKALLSSPNVDVNAVDENGNTPLIEAARFGHDKVVTALLIAHADPSIKNNEGKTALMLAAEGRHDETVKVLTEAGTGK